MAEAIEMETLGISEKIDRNNEKIDKNNEEIKQIKKTLNIITVIQLAMIS